jgi:nitrite reductase/ring-hydroxylating ferredoxin subunit
VRVLIDKNYALVIAAVSANSLSQFIKPFPLSSTHLEAMLFKICKSSDIPENSMRAFPVEKTDVLVVRHDGVLFACNNSCPHRGASLSKGEVKGDNIICYMHGYEFNIFTGKLVNMKSWKRDSRWMEQTAAWRESGDLTMYYVEEKDNEVYVEIPSDNPKSAA